VRLATWNVNSIRTRVDRVVGFLERSDVDVLALQETKCRDDQFPSAAFEALGYEVAHVGLNQWNGVALLSRVGLDDVRVGFEGVPSWSSKEGVEPAREARAIGATCGGVRVLSLYVPNGRQLGDPHLAYKLEWLEALRADAAGWLATDPDAQVALVGDWNIAPQDDDVWDMGVFANSSPRPSGRPSPPWWTPGTPTSSGRTPPASTRTGTTRSCASPAGRACGSTSRCAPRRWPPGSPGPRSTARSARVRAPATTPRWSSNWPTDQSTGALSRV
jgi:hypothetical protein